jgi:hypothetical protein
MHRFPVVLAHVGGSALWLLLYAQSGEPSLLLPFATCYGANAAIMGLMRLKAHVPDITGREAISIATARGLVVVVLPVLVLSGATVGAALDLAGCLLAIYVATVVFSRLQPDLAAEPIDARRWMRQVLIVAAASTIAVGAHYGSMPRLDVLSLLP